MFGPHNGWWHPETHYICITYTFQAWTSICSDWVWGFSLGIWSTAFPTDLYGHPFILVTDHHTLCKIFGSKQGISPMAAARMQRWALTLSAYQYTIEHISALTVCRGCHCLVGHWIVLQNSCGSTDGSSASYCNPNCKGIQMQQGTLHCFEVNSAWSLAFRYCSRPQSLSQTLHRVINFGWLYSMGFKSCDSSWQSTLPNACYHVCCIITDYSVYSWLVNTPFIESFLILHLQYVILEKDKPGAIVCPSKTLKWYNVQFNWWMTLHHHVTRCQLWS